MAAYSMDLRERVVAACDEGTDTRGEIAERFSVSESWIRRLRQRRREAGSIAPKPRRGCAGRWPTTPTPRWRNWPGPAAWRAAPRRSTAR